MHKPSLKTCAMSAVAALALVATPALARVVHHRHHHHHAKPPHRHGTGDNIKG
jgi:hypothetical protein